MASHSHIPGCARLNVMRLNAARLNFYESVPFASVGGVARAQNLRIEGAGIEQILNDQVDTAQFRASGFVPVAGQVITVYDGDTSAGSQLFGGRIIETTRLYEGKKDNEAFDLHCVDNTWLLNRRLVLATFSVMYATDIIIQLLVGWTRNITGTNITIPRTAPYIIDKITFTNETVPVCLSAICERVGANWYLDYAGDLHAFINETPDAYPITDATPRGASELQLTEDLSQVVTKVIGRGGGANAAVDIYAGAAELPVDEAEETWYGSGLVETGAQVLTYAGVKGRGGKGAFVGTGNAPTAVPYPTPYAGSSHVIGATYAYAVSFTTAAGETLAGPIGHLTLNNIVAGPPAAVTARSRGAGSYPPGMIAPGASGQIQFAAQITYTTGAIGPLGANSIIYNWDGYDWEVYLGPKSYYTLPDGSSAFYYPVLEPGGPPAPTQHVVVYRFDHGVGWTYASSDYFTYGSGWYYQMACGYTGQPYTPPAATGVGSVLVKKLPVSKATGVTGRKLYRSVANGGNTLKLLATIANNTATEYVDTVADAALGAAPPAADTSGVKDEGQVLPGATSLPVSSTQPFVDDVGPSGGGWVRVGTMPVKYGSVGAGVLADIPATGIGSITAATRYGAQVLVQPRLYGIPPSGAGAITATILRGDSAIIRIEKTDEAARDAMANRLMPPGAPMAFPDDGIIELPVSDSRFTITELQEHVDATLLDRKDPKLTVTFLSRDPSLQVGRLVTINTAKPAINGTFRIQRISLQEIFISGGLARVQPLKRVEASNKLYKFTDLLRRLRSAEGGVR